MKELVMMTIKIFGITAPWFSWLAALVLIGVAVYEMTKLFTIYKRQSNIIKQLTDSIKDLHSKYQFQGSRGLHSQAIDQLQKLVTDIPSIAGAWHVFRSKLIYRRLNDEDDSEQVWQTESSISVFTEDVILGINFDKRRFLAVPSVLTGGGLLMTFIAILVGLYEVKIVGNKVSGMENLIGGLSGKFVSSVAGLFAATFFLMIEKKFFHELKLIRLGLVDSIDALVPLRLETHMLEEISQNISEQTNAFRTFNSDLSLKLKNSFNESMGPTLERMVLAIDDLNQLTGSAKVELLDTLKEMNHLLGRSEESRQDSITGQVETLLKNLQESLAHSIDKMSSEFSNSLTGTAQDQFSRVAETVGATAEVLGSMNKQFSDSQLALQELINLAKQSTENQFTNGSALIERMVDMLGGTMTKMGEQITGMSEKMSSTIEGTAERSVEAAGTIIGEVRALNELTVSKLVETLQKHEAQLDRVDALKKVLQDATGEFGEYVTGYNTANKDLKAMSHEANATLQVLSQSSKTLKQSQDAFNQVATLAIEKINLLASSNSSQKLLWQDIGSSMEQYKNTFSTIETSAAKILSNIADHLQNFSRATHAHFDQTVTVANDHISNAVEQLGASIENLSERIEDLNDIADKIPRGK